MIKMTLEELSAKIDAVAQAVKDSVAELEEEVNSVEEAGTNIYNSVSSLLDSFQSMTNTLLAAVQKGIKNNEHEGP